MKQKVYEKPAMKVVEVQQRTMLMTSQPVSATLNAQSNYTDGGDPFEDSESGGAGVKVLGNFVDWDNF